MTNKALTHAGGNLARENEVEILLFSLEATGMGKAVQMFGINVLKVREVTRCVQFSRVPGMGHDMEGMVSSRDELIGVVNLARHLRVSVDSVPQTLIVTECNGQLQGILVHNVDFLTEPSRSALKYRTDSVPWSATLKCQRWMGSHWPDA